MPNRCSLEKVLSIILFSSLPMFIGFLYVTCNVNEYQLISPPIISSDKDITELHDHVQETEEKVQTNETPDANDNNLMINCWLYQFNVLFVSNKLDHTFSKQYDSIDSKCKSIQLNNLLQLTNDLLLNITSILPHRVGNLNSNIHYRDLILLRRIIILFHHYMTSHASFIVNTYNAVLQSISKLESKYINKYRNTFNIFNIHPPRSAGTLICFWFKVSRNRQRRIPEDIKKYQKIIQPFDPNDGKNQNNCNKGDGCQFTHYHPDSKGKTCKQQYKMLYSDDDNMVARESPLYPNSNIYNIKHPLLCDKFIYILAVRSPIERIISWAKADTFFQIETDNGWETEKNLTAIMSNLYYSLFDYGYNAFPQNLKRGQDIIKIKDIDDPNVNKYIYNDKLRIASRNIAVRTYSSNAITKWIGYEWDQNDNDINGKNIVKAFDIPTNIFNKNDIHFFNSVKLLFKIDYVLNFASYGNDISAVKAFKYANTSLFDDILSKSVNIGENGSMWDLFSKHMESHHNISKHSGDVFSYNGRYFKHKQSMRQSVVDVLTDNDWKTLYEQNYFDFRLYVLSKMIETVDLIYYEKFNLFRN